MLGTGEKQAELSHQKNFPRADLTFPVLILVPRTWYEIMWLVFKVALAPRDALSVMM